MSTQVFRIGSLFPLLLLSALFVTAQQLSVDSTSYYAQVRTYVNPVLPGDHPDPTVLKHGDDFYHCGSSFHFTPYLPIYHSRDLVHWEVISRVVPPSKAGFVTDRPSAGIWQGAITYFYGSFWIYFSANGQWFCKADTPYGPWTDPVQLKTNPITGPLGYDNSIFVDDDGKPYMVIKNGQKINRIQALGKDGQLTDTIIKLDWINANLQYSWAEGPVMCKRNGYYYYFPAGDVTGGQYVLRGTELTGDSTKWERLGEFFKPVTDPNTGFRRPNHIAAPFQLADGTWWTIGQSYERVGTDDWSGTGRQSSLYQVIWESGRPWGIAPTSKPLEKPNLLNSGILWRGVNADYFNKDSLNLCWHFLGRKASSQYSLTARKGWLRLMPDTARAHLVQKETDHYYTAETKIDFNASDITSKAGIYLTNGNQRAVVMLYSGYDNGKQIIFRFDSLIRSTPNPFGNNIWLKVERNGHYLKGYYSGDGNKWIAVGGSINVVNLDKTQPNFNSWVGTSIGLFAEGQSSADFDLFICKDAYSSLPAIGYSNYFGTEKLMLGSEPAVTNTSNLGGWFMISGVELGERSASGIEVVASSKTKGTLEIWLDDFSTGKLIATIPVSSTGSETKWKTFKQIVKNVSGRHDVFVRFSPGSTHAVFIKAIQFVKAK